jgi:CrcB protein
MNNLVVVAAGGAIGASLRHLVNIGAMRLTGPGFPWGTLVVNIVGCFLMGLFMELAARQIALSGATRLFVATGILGGFTTFSAFSLDFALLWQRGAVSEALFYALGSVAASLLALFAGLWLVRSFG